MLSTTQVGEAFRVRGALYADLEKSRQQLTQNQQLTQPSYSKALMPVPRTNFNSASMHAYNKALMFPKKQYFPHLYVRKVKNPLGDHPCNLTSPLLLHIAC